LLKEGFWRFVKEKVSVLCEVFNCVLSILQQWKALRLGVQAGYDYK